MANVILLGSDSLLRIKIVEEEEIVKKMPLGILEDFLR